MYVKRRKTEVRTEYRKIEGPFVRGKPVNDVQRQPKDISVEGVIVNKSRSGKALQISFPQFNIVRIWFPKQYCTELKNNMCQVTIPLAFRSHLDSSQQVRVHRLIAAAQSTK